MSENVNTLKKIDPKRRRKKKQYKKSCNNTNLSGNFGASKSSMTTLGATTCPFPPPMQNNFAFKEQLSRSLSSFEFPSRNEMTFDEPNDSSPCSPGQQLYDQFSPSIFISSPTPGPSPISSLVTLG